MMHEKTICIAVALAALVPLLNLGAATQEAIAGEALGRERRDVQRAPALGARHFAAAGSAAARVAKVSAEFAGIAATDTPDYPRFRYEYVGGTARPPLATLDKERVLEAFSAARDKFQAAVDANNAERFPKRDLAENLLRYDLDEALYTGLRASGDAKDENLTRALLATMLADLVDTLGTKDFDEINLARLTDSFPGRASINEQLLMTAVAIARGEFDVARPILGSLEKAKTLGDARRGLLYRFRGVSDFLDPSVNPSDAYYSNQFGVERFEGRYRASVEEPSEDLLAVLSPIDGRMSDYTYGSRTRAAEVDAALEDAYAGLRRTLTDYRFVGGFNNDSGVGAAFDAIESAVRKRDLGAAQKEIENIRRFYATREEPLSLRDEWKVALSLQSLEDATRVLSKRFVAEDEPFFVTVNENFFGDANRSYDELPPPVAQFAEGIVSRIGFFRSNVREAQQRPVFESLNRFFNAVLDGEPADVTDKLGNDFLKTLKQAEKNRFNRGQGYGETDSRKAILADARRFAALFREGKEAVGAMNTAFVAPRASEGVNDLADSLLTEITGRTPKRAVTVDKPNEPKRKYRPRNTRPGEIRAQFRGEARQAIADLERSARDVALQPGYRQDDLIDLGTELTVIAERGEDVDAAYDRLIRPVLAFPDSEDFVRNTYYRNDASFIEQLRDISKDAQRMKQGRKPRKEGSR